MFKRRVATYSAIIFCLAAMALAGGYTATGNPAFHLLALASMTLAVINVLGLWLMRGATD